MQYCKSAVIIQVKQTTCPAIKKPQKIPHKKRKLQKKTVRRSILETLLQQGVI